MSEQPNTGPNDPVDHHQFGGTEWFNGENGDTYPVNEPAEDDNKDYEAPTDEGEIDGNSN